MRSVLDSLARKERLGAAAGAWVVEVLIARHPEVEANLEGRFVGTLESPYSALGVEQKERLVAAIGSWEPTRVLTSPRDRARMAAEEAARSAGVRLHVDEGLAEIDFGAAEGLTYEEASSRGVEMDLLGGPAEGAPFKDGETWHDFTARVAAAAARAEASGPRVAIVAHGGVARALLTHWLGLPHDAAWRFAVRNASISTLSVTSGYGTLRTFGVEAGRCSWEPGSEE